MQDGFDMTGVPLAKMGPHGQYLREASRREVPFWELEDNKDLRLATMRK